MTGVSCLYRRSSGIYAIRIVVPSRLRSLVGRGEIHASTGLTNLTGARLVALRIQHQWREKFMSVDLQRLSISNPLLADDGVIPVVEAAKAIGLSEGALLNELLAERAQFCVLATQWPGWWVANIDDIERDYDGAFILNSVETHGERMPYSGLARAFQAQSTATLLLTSGSADASVLLGCVHN
jgi:hypothetical protein